MAEIRCLKCQASFPDGAEACPNCGERVTHFQKTYSTRLIDGKYQIIERLGVGGMGEIFLVRHIHLNEERVIKVMKANIASDEQSLQRFLQEARTSTMVKHRNLAMLYDQRGEKEKAEAAQKKLEQERMTIDESRRRQLQCKQQDKEAERKLSELYVQELARINKQQQDLARQKELTKRKQNMELRKMQQQQICENEKRRAKEKEETLKEQHEVFHNLKKEDDIFKDFVMKEIESFKVRGKRTALLEKTLNS